MKKKIIQWAIGFAYSVMGAGSIFFVVALVVNFMAMMESTGGEFVKYFISFVLWLLAFIFYPLIKASNLFSKYPDGIIIGGALIIEHNNGANLIIEGFNKKYNNFNPNYLLKWELIKKYNKEKNNYFNLNGIVGEFIEKNKYSGLNEMKLGYNASAIEYIGEFNLIINRTVYNVYQNILKKGKKQK